LFVLLGLCAAISRVFTTQSDQRYVLIEKRDLLLGFVLTIASVVGFYFVLRVLW